MPRRGGDGGQRGGGKGEAARDGVVGRGGEVRAFTISWLARQPQEGKEKPQKIFSEEPGSGSCEIYPAQLHEKTCSQNTVLIPCCREVKVHFKVSEDSLCDIALISFPSFLLFFSMHLFI